MEVIIKACIRCVALTVRVLSSGVILMESWIDSIFCTYILFKVIRVPAKNCEISDGVTLTVKNLAMWHLSLHLHALTCSFVPAGKRLD